ncbi:formylglycine-generating enzyme family protein [Leptospira ognonensis]|uniref:Formylglycine-generating enzyme family protein n=2 Tax=Leptospira ognonensis TaxID=2484945 RepID=A0A4R9JW05_9LEPT|nr:SUMF1/EgtB/PvdO family nonheme iron enzyme [Leptospira ognonensis]TGL57153.1 formylglycine-generating enzyme family protein [Leptospira ognonensis]
MIPMNFLIILLASFLFADCHLLSEGLFEKPCAGKIIPDMKCIPEGEFIRGSNKFEKNEKPEAKIYLDGFFMDTHEVTNEKFEQCLHAGRCRDCLSSKKCDFVGARYGKIYQRPKQPVVGVSWYTASEYCQFVGKRLPTEAEWEKAARGSAGDVYPWGNESATCQKAIIEEEGRKGCALKKLEKPHWMTTDDVGTRAPGHYGLFDMAGNSWEWVSDWYSPSYEVCGPACQGKNPKGPCNGDKECPGHNKKIVKGGSWWWPGSMARGSYRRAHVPENFPEYHHFGFRCAKDIL